MMLVVCSTPLRSVTSRSNSATYAAAARSSSSAAAIAACRSRSAPRRARHSACWSSASITSSSKPSVTPLQADSTIASRGRRCDSTMSATRWKQLASATLEPPNLCTTQASPPA
jgi:hypothetical protein